MANLNRLKVVLVEQQKTGKWLAEQIGKSNCTVSKWCSNSVQPDLKTIIFQPTRNLHIELELPNLRSNYRSILSTLYKLQEQKLVPITYKLDYQFIYISYDEGKVSDYKLKHPNISNRYMAIDINPNYIGYSIVEWLDDKSYNVIKTGLFNIKKINDIDNELINDGVKASDPRRKYITNKRRYELFEISKELIALAVRYRVNDFGVEKLKIQTKNHKKGKKFNKLVNNQWVRTDFINNLRKRCSIYKINFHELFCAYSSFVGNLVFRDLRLPDPILASIELTRRIHEKKKNIKDNENIKFPYFQNFIDAIQKSLEELRVVENFGDWKSLYDHIKKIKLTYRFSLPDNGSLVRCFSDKSLVMKY